MFQVVLKKNSRSVKTMDLPEQISEVTLSQAVMFTNRHEQYQAWLRDQSDTEFTIEQQITQIRMLTECVAGFLDIPVEDIMDIKLGKDKGIDKWSAIDSMHDLMAYIIGVLSQYKYVVPAGSDYRFEHNGIEYYIPGFFQNALGENSEADLSIAETIEVLEVKRLAERNENKDNSRFTAMISTIAILARKDGEVFPDEQYQIDAYIKQRLQTFKDIRMQVAFDIGFFLTSSMWI